MDALFSFLKDTANAIRRRKASFFVFFAFWLCGVALGALVQRPVSLRYYYKICCENYLGGVLISSALSLFCRRFFHCALLYALYLPSFFTALYLPIPVFLLLFKGYVFGVATVTMFSSFGLSGVFAWGICALPTALGTAFSCVCLCCVAKEARSEKRGCASNDLSAGNIERIFPYAAVSAIFAAACAILELVFALGIFRPLSKIF